MLKLPRSGSKGNHKEIIGRSRKQILYVQYGSTNVHTRKQIKLRTFKRKIFS